jgi:hypothetical protein
VEESRLTLFRVLRHQALGLASDLTGLRRDFGLDCDGGGRAIAEPDHKPREIQVSTGHRHDHQYRGRRGRRGDAHRGQIGQEALNPVPETGLSLALSQAPYHRLA